ncbi:MAG: hypothetical protein IJ397_10435 [Lachnospiraceae bacterium]|nr:hypothetical protein [Lachnospiraceae bacterium]MBQ7767247.1 hypothetical protein [Lachnospiraceae bacterium]
MGNEIFSTILMITLNLKAFPVGILSSMFCGFMSAYRLKKPSKKRKINPVIWCDLVPVILTICALLIYVAIQHSDLAVRAILMPFVILYWAIIIVLAVVYPVIIGGAVIVTIVAVVRYFMAKKKDSEKKEWWKKYISGCLIWDAGLLLPGAAVYYLMHLLALSF